MIRIFNHYISTIFITLFVAEYCVFFASIYFGSDLLFLQAKSWYSNDSIVLESFIFATVTSLCLAGVGLYRRTLAHNDYELFSRMAVGFFFSVFVIFWIYYFFPQYFITKSVLIYILVLEFFGMMTCRFIFIQLLGKRVLKKRILVVGCGNNAKKILQSNTGYIREGFEIVGCYATKNEQIMVDPQHIVLTFKENFFDFIKKYNIDEIVIAMDDRRVRMPLDDLLDCKIQGTKIVDLLSFYEREKAYIDLDNLKPSWLVFSDGFAKNGMRTSIKRFVDIISSLTLLLVTLPAMLLTALAISIECGFAAPVFYRQVRVGVNNKNFNVLKFRSMRTDAEKQGIQFAITNDKRITRVGGFIRKCRIDELPQIFNVLKGEMSFVGPRPERPEFVEGYNKGIPYYKERHRVKPGITGWAQLRYPYGENEYDATQKLQYDLYYVKNYSLFLDLTIILHTVEVVLWGKGAR